MRNAQNETHEKVEVRRPSRQLGLPVLLGGSGPPSAGVVFIEPPRHLEAILRKSGESNTCPLR